MSNDKPHSMTTFDDLQSQALLSEIKDLLERLASRNVHPATPPGMHFLDETPRTVMQNLRVSHFVASADATGVIRLLIGTRAYSFQTVTGGVVSVPFTMTIPSGVDVSVACAGHTIIGAYLIYEPE